MLSGISSKLALGAVWLVGARLLANIGGFVGTLVLARLLLPEDFGLVAIAVTIAAIVSAVTELSVAAALIHLRTLDENHFHSAWTLNVIRGALLATLIAGLAWPVAAAYGDGRLVSIMLALAGISFCWSLSNPKLVVFSRNLVFWQEATIGLAQKLATLLCSIGVAVAFRSHWAIVAGQFAGVAVALALGYAFIPFRPRPRLHDVRRILSFSVWLSAGQAMNTLNYKADPLLIGYLSGSAALGQYTVADNLAALPTREAVAPLSSTLFPGFTKVVDDPEALRAAFRRAQSVLGMVALPAGFGLALVAEPMVLLAMGERWAPAIPIIQALSGIIAVSTLGMGLQPLAMAMGETRAVFRRDLANLLIRLPLILTGALLGGLMGAVYARCVSSFIGTAISMALVRRLIALPIRAQLWASRRTILATLAMVAGVQAVPALMPTTVDETSLGLRVAATVLGGAAIYVTVLLGAWLAAGRPAGAEHDLLRVAGRVLPPLARLL